MRSTIPVIDLFAGPGGLGEGFSAFKPIGRINRAFRIILSVEKDLNAHQTLELRSFFRQFSRHVPDDYYSYLRAEITRDELFQRFPIQAAAARNEAMLAELSKDDDLIYEKIEGRLVGLETRPWILVGGPPCQAYSYVGRAKQTQKILSETDTRQVLYQEYLKIIARFRPAIFVMENVKGMLSSTARLDENARPHLDGKKERIFQRILRDLKQPIRAVRDIEANWSASQVPGADLTYKLYPLAVADNQDSLEPSDYIIRSEDYGVPQARHRVILVGVRSDINETPNALRTRLEGKVPIESVIGDLPPLRSQISKYNIENCFKDSPTNWEAAIKEILKADWLDTYLPPVRAVQLRLFEDARLPEQVRTLQDSIRDSAAHLLKNAGIGGNFVRCKPHPRYKRDWYVDSRLLGVCNHESRGHMESDLRRYLYLSSFAEVHGVSPTMKQFPKGLLPKHANLKNIESDDEVIFDDRFRVQVKGQPATTIASHISKDGHYNVHYDPRQCRSLTVREAARVQTFPDNYFFEGPRTEQYQQVGNAVPPLLAYQIAEVVYDLLERTYGGH